MKKQKKFIVFALIATLFVMFASVGTSFAGWFYTVDLVKVQAGPTGVVVAVKKADTTVIQKFIDSTNQNTLLAVALTAQSMGAKVHVNLDTAANIFTDIIITTE